MITEIKIKAPGCFADTEEYLKDLKAVNYIYGPNGSGKTTISKIIGKCGDYDDCSLSWSSASEEEILVYNRDFIKANFNPDDEIKGIFTLGEANEETVSKIASGRLEIKTLNDAVANLKKARDGDGVAEGKVQLRDKNYQNFAEVCWAQKLKHEAHFKEAFRGFLNSRDNFTKEFISQTNNGAILRNEADLIADSKTVFENNPETEESIQKIPFQTLKTLNAHPILQKIIVGKNEIDIAAMISKLENVDWVRQGKEYFEDNDETCPFCQQNTPTSFKESLESYFDEEYTNNLSEIDTLILDYDIECDIISIALENIRASGTKFLSLDAFSANASAILGELENNKRKLLKKKKEPSRAIQLVHSEKLYETVATLIRDANESITAHNAIVNNLSTKKEELRAQIWRFVLSEIEAPFAIYAEEDEKVDKAINGLTASIEAKEKSVKEKSISLSELEKQITSIQPTIDEINRLLGEFGFKSFKLDKADNTGFYKIIRENGDDAKETLSEGEKTFITFLYFYYLLIGAHASSGAHSDRVIVIDDPVSSLDSDILFIVSSLIKKIISHVRDDASNFNQIIVFTHNIYFHKEVTFDSKRSGDGTARNYETFWTIRKGKCSTIHSHPENPIKSSYELLWSQVRNDEKDSTTIQNVLRRILEHYFQFLGGISREDITNTFTGEEKMICAGMFSWINDGSHFAQEDLYVDCDESSVDKYLGVFKAIFVNMDHEAHYNMMMGIENSSD